ncbi:MULTISPECIES: DUF6702 family protein [Novosphingobium]|uniref:DUF6702 family protein n=1 Tax=Novosphingobium TaxID=165696 RepID=UPI000D6E6B64|nr:MULTISPECIES: DUF6702 family protein [Novosphingobium]
MAAMLRFAAAFAVMAAAASAQAHRGHDAMSVVTIEPGGHLVVSHRFEAHDLEPALAAIAPAAQTSLDDPDAIEALKGYLQARFTIRVGATPVPLAFRSIDVGVQQVRVDYEGTLRGTPKTLSLQSTILRDVYAKQVNQVVVRRGQTVRTLRLAGSEAQIVSF